MYTCPDCSTSYENERHFITHLQHCTILYESLQPSIHTRPIQKHKDPHIQKLKSSESKLQIEHLNHKINKLNQNHAIDLKRFRASTNQLESENNNLKQLVSELNTQLLNSHTAQKLQSEQLEKQEIQIQSFNAYRIQQRHVMDDLKKNHSNQLSSLKEHYETNHTNTIEALVNDHATQFGTLKSQFQESLCLKQNQTQNETQILIKKYTDDLCAQYSKYEGMVQSFESQLLMRQDDIDRLNSDWAKQCDELVKRTQCLQSKLKKTEDELEQTRSTLLDQLNTMRVDHQNSISNLQTTLHNLQSELSNQTNINQSHISHIAVLESEIQHLHEQLKDANETHRIHKAHLQKEFYKQLDQKHIEIEQSKADQMNQLENTILKLESKLRKQSRIVNETNLKQSQWTKSEELNIRLQKEIKDMTLKLNENKSTLTHYESLNKKINSQLDAMKVSSETQIQKNSELIVIQDKLKEEILTLNLKLKEEQDQINTLQSKFKAFSRASKETLYQEHIILRQTKAEVVALQAKLDNKNENKNEIYSGLNTLNIKDKI